MMSQFRVIIISKISMLLFSILIFAYLLFETDLILSPTAALLLIVLQVATLIKFIETTNQHFIVFLKSLRQSDFSVSPLPPSLGNSFGELKKAYTDLIEDFKTSRAETEEKVRYLELILMQVRVGLIGFNQDGIIDLFNNTAKRYLKCSQIRTFSDLNTIHPNMTSVILNAKKKLHSIVKLEVDGDYLQLVLNVSTIHYRNSHHTLVSFYNIQDNLEEKELEAWHDLIRVLTHEIMNSITPIVSLAGTAEAILQNESDTKSALNNEQTDKLTLALSTIHKRSLDLHRFVQNYRKLSRLPNPDFESVSLSKLFRRVEILMEQALQAHEIDFKSEISPLNLQLLCDSNMIEQLLINLIRNSIDAMQSTEFARIALSAYRSDVEQIVIELTDNGAGIEADVVSRIFIPFFTTRPNGSGIGLSLSRQIMRLHGGSIHVSSIPNQKTVFRLLFKV